MAVSLVVRRSSSNCLRIPKNRRDFLDVWQNGDTLLITEDDGPDRVHQQFQRQIRAGHATITKALTFVPKHANGADAPWWSVWGAAHSQALNIGSKRHVVVEVQGNESGSIPLGDRDRTAHEREF